MAEYEWDYININIDISRPPRLFIFNIRVRKWMSESTLLLVVVLVVVVVVVVCDK